MTVYREWHTATRLAAILAAGFRVAVIAGFVSLVSMPAALADNEGKGGGDSSASDSPGSSGDRGDKGSPGESSRSDSAPGNSDDGRGSGSRSSPGNSASSSGNSASARASAPGQNRGSLGGGRSDRAVPSPPGLNQADALNAVRADEIFSLKELLPRVTDRYSGKVIDVALWPEDDRLVYSFKLRTENGTIRTIRIDARTGRYLGLGAFFR